MITKQMTYIIIIAIAIIAIIFLYGKYKGRQMAPDDIKLPSDTQPVGTSGIWNPGFTTDSIFNDLDSTFSVHDSKVLSDALKLSNSQLVAINNDWNKRYFVKAGNETLIQAIQGDISLVNYTWDVDAYNLIERLKTLVKQ